MPKNDEYVYLTLPKGMKPPAGYEKTRKSEGDGLWRKKITVDLFSAVDMKKMIKRNISSKSKGGKRTKKSKRSRKHRTRKH